MPAKPRLATLTLSPADCRPVAYDEADGHFLPRADWLERVGRWRAAGLALKAEGGRAVALCDEDAFETSCALFGLWSAGVHTLLTGSASRETALEVARNDPALAFALALGDVAPEGARRLAPALAPAPAAPLEADAALLSLWTSGTTGEAKRVTKRLSQYLLECEAIEASLAEETSVPGERLVVFGSVTHQHIYGLLFRIGWPLLSGAVMTRRRLHYPETLAKAMRALPEGFSPVLVSSPAHYGRLSDPSLFEGLSLPITVSSAGALDDEAARLARRALGRFPYEILGSTETGGIAARVRRLAPDGRLLTPAWTPAPGVLASLEGNTRPQVGDTGRLRLDGCRLWASEGETADDVVRVCALENGRLGAFELVGRADKIVKVEGKRLAPAALERRILADARVAGEPAFCALRAIVLTDRRESVALAAALTPAGQALLLRSGRRALLTLAREAAAEHFEAVLLPKRLRIVTAMPVNAQGKTTVQALAALFKEGEPDFTPLARQGATSVWAVTLSPALKVFAGHFPQYPLLPGVATLEFARRAASLALGATLGVREVKNLKFKAPVTPGGLLVYRLDTTVAQVRFACYRIENSVLSCDGTERLFEVLDGETPCAQGVLVTERF